MQNGFWSDKKILLTGGAGFLGSMINKKLLKMGITPDQTSIPRSTNYDLRIWHNCEQVVKDKDIVIHLAARVGGIGYNQKYPGTLFYDNLMMGVQLMEASRLAGVEKFVAIGTICAYPKYTPVPFQEKDLWNGYPEETNAPYGLAKKMLLVQSQAYRSQYNFQSIYLLPVNLYGPGDRFHLEHSHVIPALIRKMIEARDKKENKVVLWGTGKASREFLYVEDAADAILLATQKYTKSDPVNIGSGMEITIKDLANLIADLTNYNGDIIWDATKPDGQPRRCLDTSRAQKEFGFSAKTPLENGISNTIQWFEQHKKEASY